MTVAEYLQFEENSEIRHEFYDGEVFAMSGGYPSHSFIAENLSLAVGGRLKGSPCRTASSDLRVRIEASGFHTYPDKIVICGDPRYALDNANTLLNPIIIFEVLSPSTERHDRTFKLDQYRLIPSLKQYILVDQKSVRVEVYSPSETGWLLESFSSLDDSIRLAAEGISVPLADIYDGIVLDGIDETQSIEG